MSYEQLDFIADLFNLFLFFSYIAISIVFYTNKKNRHLWAKGLFSLLACYSIMFVDQYFGVWALMSLDYSTHSTIAFSLSAYICFAFSKNKYIVVSIIALLLAYFILEVYQKYHTWSDIISSIAILLPVLLAIYNRKFISLKTASKF